MPYLPPVTKTLLLACVAVFCLNLFAPLEIWFALWPWPADISCHGRW